MFEYLKEFLQQKNHLFIKNLLIFAVIFMGIFVITFGVLGVLGFMPTEFQSEVDDTSVASRLQQNAFKELGLMGNDTETPSTTIVHSEKGELPYRLVATSIKLDTPVVRPSTTNYIELDNSLSHGAVYYPGSGLAGKGNMFIFGHSTSYSYVNNKAYQVFNGIKNLKEGDEIKVYGEQKVYIYKVRDVKLVNATQELVSFSNDRTMLTLSTCNSFGQKTDRYVAEADFVTTYSL